MSTKTPGTATDLLTSTERGKAARKAVPRAAHAVWEPGAKRPDPVGILEAQGESRVQELLPIRRGRMLVSPFTFYRGAAAIMADDLATTPASGIRVQLCGDAHVSNFGGFAAPDRSLVFDLNDFDETAPGPWEWDVKRLAASLEIAGRDRGMKPAIRSAIVQEAVRSYREAMRGFATMTNLAVWYARLDITAFTAQLEAAAKKKDRRAFDKAVRKAQAKTSERALSRLTEMVDGEPRFLSQPPLLVPLAELLADEGAANDVRDHVLSLIHSYDGIGRDREHLLTQYRAVDVARKVVGVGSVGTRAWVILLLGRDGNDPLVLQAKEAQTSVLEPYAGESRYGNHGERVVEGQRLMQAASDIFLGWLRVKAPDGVDRDFYVRQLWDGKGSADLTTINAERLAGNARACGWTLARAHARSGDRVAIASYLGGGDAFDRAIAAFAADYADQNELDYAAMRTAVDSGQLEAETGV